MSMPLLDFVRGILDDLHYYIIARATSLIQITIEPLVSEDLRQNFLNMYQEQSFNVHDERCPFRRHLT